jgi:hypothetical protein
MSLRALVEAVSVLARLERVLAHHSGERLHALAVVLRVGARRLRVALLADGLELAPQRMQRADRVLVGYRASEPSRRRI